MKITVIAVSALALAACASGPVHYVAWKPYLDRDVRGREIVACNGNVNGDIPRGLEKTAVADCLKAKGYKVLYIPMCPNWTETNYVRAHPLEVPKCDDT